MKTIKIIGLFCAALFCGCVLFGCASKKPVPAPEPPPVVEAKPVYPLRPIDQNIVDQVLESGDSLKMLQYYISDTVTLAKESLRQDMEVRDGAGLRREVSASGQIVIKKETAGILARSFYGPDKRRVLAVSFDETSDRDTLFFMWNPAQGRFTLDYDIESRLAGYGDQKYLVSFSGDTPYLLIRFSEEKANKPSERVIRGRFIP